MMAIAAACAAGHEREERAQRARIQLQVRLECTLARKIVITAVGAALLRATLDERMH